MTQFDRYVLHQIAVPSLLAMAALSFLGVANEIRERLNEMPVALVTVGDLSRLGAYFVPTLISYIVPIMYLLGILMAFGRLAQNGEITAIKAAGVPLKRVVAPVIITGGLLSVAGFLIQDRIQPWAYERALDLVYSELPKRATMDMLPAGIMHEYEGWHVYFARKDPKTLTLYDIDLVRPEGAGEESVYHADSARLVRDSERYEIVLQNGRHIGPGGVRTSFDVFSFTVPGPSELHARGRRGARSFVTLLESERALAQEFEATRAAFVKDDLRKERRQIGERLNLPLAALAVAFVAAPLGVRARRAGRSYSFAVGFSIIVFYYVLQMLLTPRSLHSLPDVILRAAIPNIILIIVGTVLLRRVDRI